MEVVSSCQYATIPNSPNPAVPVAWQVNPLLPSGFQRSQVSRVNSKGVVSFALLINCWLGARSCC